MPVICTKIAAVAIPGGAGQKRFLPRSVRIDSGGTPVTRTGIVCIFAYGENRGSARSSPRRRRSSAPHLFYSIPVRAKNKDTHKCVLIFW